MGFRLVLACVTLAASPAVFADGSASSTYLPLRVGNWWAYEEQGAEGNTLSRETWNVVAADAHSRAGEFHLRSLTKRLDALGHTGDRFEGHEYLRESPDGLRKRYPAGGAAELEVLLVKEPASHGTRWRDAQGSCEVAERAPCAGPHGPLHDCLTIVCTLGEPPATIVTSTYARGVGMVRQEVNVLQLIPAMDGPATIVPSDARRDGHSLLRLTDYHVRPR